MPTAQLASLSSAQPSTGRRHLGYSAAGWRRQAALETQFRDVISADSIATHHAVVTNRPHMAGTDGARVVAESIATMLKRSGLEVEVIEYQAYLSTPRTTACRPITRSSPHAASTYAENS